MMKTENNRKRNSSVELFRIIATFLVLIVHFNGWFVGGMPKRLSIFDTFHISQAFIEALSCTCVNCFLIITGWYGLKFKWKHVWTIWSILVFIYVPSYLINSYIFNDFSIKVLLFQIIAIGQESYYIQCYLMLLFLSPILNSFIHQFGRRILPYTLAFWGIEIVFDWILDNNCLAFGKGYMLTHFVFMYLLGQTSHMYVNDITKHVTIRNCLLLYIIGMLLITGIYTFTSAETAFAYTNPINVVMSLSLFLIFEARRFYSPIINWISSSTLAVYILHITPPIINALRKYDLYLLQSLPYGTYLISIGGVIFMVFSCGILYDKIRILIFTKPGVIICSWISNKLKKYSLSNE